VSEFRIGEEMEINGRIYLVRGVTCLSTSTTVSLVDAESGTALEVQMEQIERPERAALSP